METRGAPITLRGPAAAGLVFTGFVTAKMVGLEAVNLPLGPVEVKLVAFLLPLAMLFGVYGVVGMTVACASAHAVFYHGPLDLAMAASSAFLGSLLAWRLFAQKPTTAGVFAGTLVITAVWASIGGAYAAYAFGLSLESGMLQMLLRLWLPVNVIGFLVAEALRLAMLKPETTHTAQPPRASG